MDESVDLYGEMEVGGDIAAEADLSGGEVRHRRRMLEAEGMGAARYTARPHHATSKLTLHLFYHAHPPGWLARRIRIFSVTWISSSEAYLRLPPPRHQRILPCRLPPHQLPRSLLRTGKIHMILKPL